MALKASVKAPFLKSGRVWTGPARGAHLEGPNSLRVYSGLYQVELNRWIRRLLAPRPAIFDIGAQYGFDAIMFARLGSPEVLTVEANPELKGVIERNVQRNDMGDRVTIDINWVGDGTGDTVTLDQLARLEQSDRKVLLSRFAGRGRLSQPTQSATAFSFKAPLTFRS